MLRLRASRHPHAGPDLNGTLPVRNVSLGVPVPSRSEDGSHPKNAARFYYHFARSLSRERRPRVRSRAVVRAG